jgi:dTMP kinase
MPRGWFITFEGGEGTGKSTQVERVAAWLRSLGREVVVTREPGGTPLAEAARAVLLDPAHEPDGLVEVFLLEAARHDHTQRVIRPALEAGAVVVCDRYADSSTVYQGMVRGLGVAEVERLNRLATGGLEPDRTVVLDLDPGEGLRRARRRNAEDEQLSTRLDDEPDPFHVAVREGFLRLAGSHPDRVVVVDARGTADEVFHRVREALAGVVA